MFSQDESAFLANSGSGTCLSRSSTHRLNSGTAVLVKRTFLNKQSSAADSQIVYSYEKSNHKRSFREIGSVWLSEFQASAYL